MSFLNYDFELPTYKRHFLSRSFSGGLFRPLPLGGIVRLGPFLPFFFFFDGILDNWLLEGMAVCNGSVCNSGHLKSWLTYRPVDRTENKFFELIAG